MKTFDPPDVDDISELRLIADNKRLGSYPDLMNEYIRFRDQYSDYVNHGGDPWNIAPLPIPEHLKNTLIKHYEVTPKGRLEFIDEFRRKLSPVVCIMCGGFGNGTLDHYLPKSMYPEYSFFSKNLIPSCNCNSLRGTAVKGATSPERAIHPYFDNFLDQRLYQSVFKGKFETPIISIEVLDNNHPKVDLLQFHLDKVINNDATQGWFEKYWSDLSQRPHDILELVLGPSSNPLTEHELKSSIERYRNSKDKEFDTPNNWLSIFYTGLINDQARLVRLADIINALR
jgi:hypothetical protein